MTAAACSLSELVRAGLFFMTRVFAVLVPNDPRPIELAFFQFLAPKWWCNGYQTALALPCILHGTFATALQVERSCLNPENDRSRIGATKQRRSLIHVPLALARTVLEGEG